MRYEKFLLDPSEIPEYPDDSNDGLNAIHYDISQVEQCENRNQNRILEAIFYTLCELLEIRDVEMQTTVHFNSLFLITKNETDFNCQKGFESPQLSRKKLKHGQPKEIAEAIIDLLLNRSKWDTEKSYSAIYL